MRQYFDMVVRGPLIFLNFWMLLPIAYARVLWLCVTSRPATQMPFLHKIPVSIAPSPQCSWLGLVLTEVHIVPCVTLHTTSERCGSSCIFLLTWFIHVARTMVHVISSETHKWFALVLGIKRAGRSWDSALRSGSTIAYEVQPRRGYC